MKRNTCLSPLIITALLFILLEREQRMTMRFLRFKRIDLVFHVLLLLFYSIILNGAVSFLVKIDFFPQDYRLAFSLFIILQLFFVAPLLLKKFKHIDQKLSIINHKILPTILLSFAILISLVLIVDINVVPAVDSQEDIDVAAYIAQGNSPDGNGVHSVAMENWPHNHFFVTVLILISKPFFGLGLSTQKDYLFLLEIVNAVCIWLAVFIAYRCIKNAKHQSAANLVLTCLVFNPLLYVLIFHIYTITFSFPFMLGILYAYIKYQKTHQLRYIVILSSCAVLAYQIRVTAFFPFIAILLIELCSLLAKICRGKKLNWQPILKSVIVFCLVFALGIAVCNYQKSHYLAAYQNRSAYPLSCWLATGANVRHDGTYDHDFRLAIDSYGTTEEKAAFCRDTLIERYKQNGVFGSIWLIVKKTTATFSHPVAPLTQKFFTQNQNIDSEIQEWTFGDKSGFLALLIQLYFILITVIAIRALLRRLKLNMSQASSRPLTIEFSPSHSFTKVENIVLLTTLGGFVFHSFWEAAPYMGLQFILYETIFASCGLISHDTKMLTKAQV